MSDYSEMIKQIREYLELGNFVQITTYTKSTLYSKKHVDFFKLGKDGSPLVRRGKNWDDFRYAAVRFYKAIK